MSFFTGFFLFFTFVSFLEQVDPSLEEGEAGIHGGGGGVVRGRGERG